MITREEINDKLEKLRQEWKTAANTDRHIIEIRASYLKMALEKMDGKRKTLFD